MLTYTRIGLSFETDGPTEWQSPAPTRIVPGAQPVVMPCDCRLIDVSFTVQIFDVQLRRLNTGVSGLHSSLPLQEGCEFWLTVVVLSAAPCLPSMSALAAC
jgi:hypothetical protein